MKRQQIFALGQRFGSAVTIVALLMLFCAPLKALAATTGDISGPQGTPDGKVDTYDFLKLKSVWHTAASCCDLAASANNYIDIADMSVLLSNWSATTTVGSQLPTEFFGVNGQAQLLWGSGVNTDAVLSDLEASGVKFVRVNMEWHWVYCDTCDPANGAKPNWSTFDKIANDLAAHHLRMEPMVGFAPAWASAGYPDGGVNAPPDPAHMQDWLDFVAAVVQRYGSNGTFWSSHAALPKVPIQTYEIWNEENAANGANWTGAVGATTAERHANWVNNTAAPAIYAQLFRSTYSTIKGLDANSKVIVGGLTGGPSSMSASSDASGDIVWMQRMMAADPTLPMDGIGIHPYAKLLAAPSGTSVESLLDQFHTGIAGLPTQASDAPLYITEVGWAADSPDITTLTDNSLTPASPQEATRAQNLFDLVTYLKSLTYPVAQIAPHTAVTRESSDTNGYLTTREDWMGIWNRDGSRKPSAQRYVDAIQTASK